MPLGSQYLLLVLCNVHHRVKFSLGSLPGLITLSFSYLLTTLNIHVCVVLCISCSVYLNLNSMIVLATEL